MLVETFRSLFSAKFLSLSCAQVYVKMVPMRPLGCGRSAFKGNPSSKCHETLRRKRKQKNERKTEKKCETIDAGTKGDLVATSASLRPLQNLKKYRHQEAERTGSAHTQSQKEKASLLDHDIIVTICCSQGGQLECS